MSADSPGCRRCGAPLEGEGSGRCFSCLAHELLHPTSSFDSAEEKPVCLRDFRLLERLGEGGMGVVYRAWQSSLQRLVALKLIRAGEFANAAEISRFRAEAEAVAGLTHPNIVPIHEIGEEQGFHYFSMQLLEGGSLAQRLSQQGPLPQTDAASLMVRVARAVHHAHQRGILHRDLKPGNILLDEAGDAFVSDFGLARRLGSESSLTLTGQILGTPNYMAPEQAAGERQLTVGADVFSLGAILYELLAGAPPFQGGHLLDTLQRVVHETPPPPSKLRGHASEAGDLDIICLKCLAKDPTRRYPSAEALADDLERWLRKEPISARPVSALERAQLWSRRHSALALSLAITALALLATVGIALAAAWRLKGERDRTREAEWNATLKLAQSSLAQARAENLSRASGFRRRSLKSIAIAASIAPSLALRNEAIHALSRFDLGDEISWNSSRPVIGLPVFTGDLGTVAQAGANGVVLFHDTQTAMALPDLPVGPGLKGCLGFSPDDRFLAVAYVGHQVGLWDLQSRVECWRRDLGGPPDEVGLQFDSREPVLYVGSGSNRLDVIQRSNAAAMFSIPLPWTPHLFAISPDGRRLAVTSGRLTAVCDSRTGDLQAEFTAKSPIMTVAWHPDSRRVGLGSESGEIALWHPEAQSHQVFAGEPQAVATLAFHPDGFRMASGHWNSVSQLWDIPSGQQILTHRGEFGSAFSGNGTYLVSGRSSIRPMEQPLHLRTLSVPLGTSLHGLAFSPNGRWLAASSSSGLYVWEADSSVPAVSQTVGPKSAQIAFTLDGRSIVSRSANRFWISKFDEASVTLTAPQELPPGPMADLRSEEFVQGFGTLFPTDLKYHFQSGTVRFVDLSDPSRSYRLTPFTPGTLSLSRRAHAMATFSEHRGELLIRSADGVLRSVPTKYPGGVLLLNPRNDQLAQFSHSRLTMYSAETGAVLWERPQDTAATMFPGFSHDGGFLAVAGTSSPDVWILNPASGEELAILPGPDNKQIFDLAIRPDDHALAVGYHSFIRLWSLPALRRQLADLKLDWSLDGASETAR